MSYESISIKKIIEKIGNNQIYLPAIQRKFVWKPDQIEKLFDSIMRGYPIGTFLFWFIQRSRTNIDDYVFYKFLQNYHERDKYLNDKAPTPEIRDEIIGVLDGQQRLGSVYIALQGSYAIKKKHSRWDDNRAFPPRQLYLNLLSEVLEEEDEELNYSFKFLTNEEAGKKTERDYWLDVRNVINWQADPPIDEFYDELLDNTEDQTIIKSLREKRGQIKKNLRILHSRLINEKLINYFKIEEKELDDILKIFIRVNSGGTVLSKTDLLFSTIIATWEEGRSQIEQFITEINRKGNGFQFNNDFVMRSCLVLTDCPVIFKVNSFKKENVEKIQTEWTKIRDAIDKTVDLLVEIGINGENLASQNAIILIAYYIVKGGVVNSKIKKEFQLYIIHALLKNIFSGQGDAVLTNLRNALRDENNNYKLKKTEFEFSQFLEARLTSNKSFRITDEDIEDFLSYKKSANSFLILSILYPQLRFGQVSFHQDHIHPAAMFTKTKLKQNNVPEEKFELWKQKKDMLPNLQLMEGSENKSKGKNPFKLWIEGSDSNGLPNVLNQELFKETNYIPINIDLEISNFEIFYEKRKAILKEKLKSKFYMK